MTAVLVKEPRLVFRGAEEVANDRNNPACYDLYCSCQQFLGSLGTFAANTEGMRSAGCPCGLVTVIDHRGIIVCHGVLPKKSA